MNAFADALDAVFGDANFGVAAIYTPPGGGAAVACRVIRNLADRAGTFGESRPLSDGAVLEVRASEVAEPRRGGTFTIGVAVHTIVGDPQREDPERLVWTCTVR